MSMSSAPFLRASSGSSVPLLNHVSTPGDRATGPQLLDFTAVPEDALCPTRQWYMSLPAKTFHKLQYRKNRDGLKHEFILVELNDGTFCRFDRRGTGEKRGEVILWGGIEAEDVAQVFSKDDSEYQEVQKSKVEITINFPKGQDLIVVLAACYGISVDEHARRYSLTQFNCFFFSWTILLTTARHTVDWSILSRDSELWDRFVQSSMQDLVSSHNQPESGAGLMLHKTLKAKESNKEAFPFVGSDYLVQTLREALGRTRPEIAQTLDELVLQSTVGNSICVLLERSLGQAAINAAKQHAYHAARDAALEAVVETMWQTMFSNPNAGSEWEDVSRAAEMKVREAANLAADTSIGKAIEGQEWENAWDMSWGVADTFELISIRAKGAWKDAWTKACLANKIYLRKITAAAVAYIESNLPDSTPETLNVQKPTLNFLSSDMSNKSLQVYIKERIRILVRNTATVADERELMEGMCRVWKSSLTLINQNWRVGSS